MSADVLDRVAAANPVPEGRPASAWSAAALLDEIDARRGHMTKTDAKIAPPAPPPGRGWGMRLAAAAGAFAVVLAAVGVVAWLGSGPEDDEAADPTTTVATTEPTTTVATDPTTEATDPTTPDSTPAPDETTAPEPSPAPPADTSVAAGFYEAYLEGDWDLARSLADDPLILIGENANAQWGIEVLGIECEAISAVRASCTATQVDAMTRQINAAYVYQNVGRIDVVDGAVTQFSSELQPDPIFDRYEAWLAAEAPPEWTASGCEAGPAFLDPDCVPVYIAYVSDWLATDPDLSGLETAQSALGIAASFYTKFAEGDWDAALALAGGTVRFGTENVGPIWGIEVVDIDCEQPVTGSVRCIITQIDSMTTQISAAYTYGNRGLMSVSNGMVTAFNTELLPDPIYERYEAWLAALAPSEWTAASCEAGPAVLVPDCVPVYIDYVPAWLATNPDLSELDG